MSHVLSVPCPVIINSSCPLQIVDPIIAAYRCGTFDKILEFIKLRDRLNISHHYATFTCEHTLVQLLVGTSFHAQTVQMMSYLEIEPEKGKVEFDKLRDNRDFQAMVSWEPQER